MEVLGQSESIQNDSAFILEGHILDLLQRVLRSYGRDGLGGLDGLDGLASYLG